MSDEKFEMSPHSLSRRSVIAGTLGTLALTEQLAAQTTLAVKLPCREKFGNIGTYLNCAATHPIPLRSAEEGQRMLLARVNRAEPEPARAPVRARLAKLINADAQDLAFVPSTGIAEYLVGEALHLGPGKGVVTDAYHFDGAIAMYRQRERDGMPLTVVRPRDGTVSVEMLARAITSETRLIAVSEISNFDGHRHDLRMLCEMAHSRGILVFADLIQTVGAIPVDVRSSGVDFCAASTYKWLMGDLGSAFLYVSPDVHRHLDYHPVGWNELELGEIEGQTTRFDARVSSDRFRFRSGAAGLFEMSMQSIINQAIFGESLNLIESIGVELISEHRHAILEYACERLPQLPGVEPLGKERQISSIAAFAVQNASQRFADAFKRDGISAGLYPHRVRLSPSIFNSKDDVDRLYHSMRNA